MSTIKNTLYISGTKVNRISDIHDDITKVPKFWNAIPVINHYKSFMLGMKALPYVGELAKQVDNVVPYRALSAGLKVLPFVAPEHAEAAMQADSSLSTVSAGLKAAPFVTNNIRQVAQKIARVMPFGKFGDVS